MNTRGAIHHIFIFIFKYIYQYGDIMCHPSRDHRAAQAHRLRNRAVTKFGRGPESYTGADTQVAV